MKKTTALTLTARGALTVLWALAALWALPAMFASAADARNKVYLITMDRMDQHWAAMDAGARKAAEKFSSLDYVWLAPDIKDDAKQIASVHEAVAAGAKVIMIAANSPDAITAALKDAAAAGVKIIYVDSAADFSALAVFSTNNRAAGKTAGEELLKALKAAGKTKGKIGVVSVNAATQSTADRDAGFRDAFVGEPFELLPSQYGEGDADRSRDIAASYIVQGVVGLFGANEGSTVGVGTAIAEDGNQTLGVGFDSSEAIRDLIKSGSLLATMAQNPGVMGSLGLEAAASVLASGYDGDKLVDTGVTVLTRDKL